MLRNIVAPLILASSIGLAKEFNHEKFQILAKDIDTEKNIVTAKGDVVVFSPTYYISAEKIVYDKDKETFELFDNVLILKDNSIQTQSDYAFIDLKNNVSNQSPVMLFEKQNNVWANSKSSSRDNNLIELDSSVISSCDCVDPAWSIRVSSATYDSEDKWLNTYNPRLYFKNVPVFYSPYFGFSTDKTRRTGLLPPTVGYSSGEGFYYSQSLFIAPRHNWDLEIIPQIRTQRGYGTYSYFRYADSPYSLLQLKAGFFKEKKDYQTEYNLDNQKHYGWDIDYERTKLFSNDKTQDGLYVSINWLNDIEYRTLENDDDTNSTEKKVESKINYFYNTPEYYAGLYARYYIDTQLDSNDSTLQELPQLHLHSYSKELLIDKLIYSLDAKYFNYTRKDGLNADVYEITLPLNYTKYFFDDFLYVNVGNKTTLSKYNYSNSSKNFSDGTLAQNETSVAIGTDLVKPYDDYLHTINLEAEYSYPKNITTDGDLYKITNNDSDLASFPIAQGSKNINISLNQSFYDNKNLNQIVNHKLSQSILYDSNDNPKLQNLENYVRYNFDEGYISTKNIYNVQDKQFGENTLNLSYKYDEDLDFNFSYYKSKETPNSGKEDLESLNFKTNYRLAKDYKMSYYENYNLEEGIRSRQGISLNIDDICWNLDIKYENEIKPSSSTTNDGIDQKIVYFNLLLKPLGGVKQKYKIEDK